MMAGMQRLAQRRRRAWATWLGGRLALTILGVQLGAGWAQPEAPMRAAPASGKEASLATEEARSKRPGSARRESGQWGFLTGLLVSLVLIQYFFRSKPPPERQAAGPSSPTPPPSQA